MVEEIDLLKRRNNEFEIKITHEWQNKLSKITQENDELKRRLMEFGDVNRKIS